MQILQSASKFVFVLMAVALIVLTVIGRVEAKDFMAACLMAFTFYFSNKGDGSQPFAGK
jgi:hypothetical protein